MLTLGRCDLTVVVALEIRHDTPAFNRQRMIDLQIGTGGPCLAKEAKRRK
jgi:hypothetical protein